MLYFLVSALFRETGALMAKIDLAKAYLRKIKKTKLSGVDGWEMMKLI